MVIQKQLNDRKASRTRSMEQRSLELGIRTVSFCAIPQQGGANFSLKNFLLEIKGND
jgi:hypothetical protein